MDSYDYLAPSHLDFNSVDQLLIFFMIFSLLDVVQGKDLVPSRLVSKEEVLYEMAYSLNVSTAYPGRQISRR